MEQLKQDLYDTFYWYFRHEYANALDLAEKENNIIICETKNAELYVQNKIEEIIERMRK